MNRDSLASSNGVGEIVVTDGTGTLTNRSTTNTDSDGNPAASPLESSAQDVTKF
jgi:hypothetical protein